VKPAGWHSVPRLPADTAAFWITVALVAVLVGYPLSFGPAVWLTARDYFRTSIVESFYRPVLWSTAVAPSLLENAVVWWGSLGVPDGELVTLEIETDDALVVLEFGDPSEYTPHRDGLM
jgi:hypothetical protein